MPVWVICRSYPHEGNGSPFRAFLTEAEGVAALAAMEDDKWSELCLFEVPLPSDEQYDETSIAVIASK